MGRRYLVLGASSELALAFLRANDWQEGDEALLQYRRPNQALVKFAEEHSFRLEQADFADMDSTMAFAERLKGQKFIPTHILHTPAAPIENKRFTEYAWAEAELQLNVQLRSLWITLQTVMKQMAKAKTGKIIIILTEHCKGVPPKFLSAYVTSKYALLGLGKALAAEYAGKNIQVNMISPAMMETKFLENVHESVVTQSAADNPMGRNARVEDVVPLVQYLFSSASSFVTGANIPVTGGEVL